jgi:hypothetical protein
MFWTIRRHPEQTGRPKQVEIVPQSPPVINDVLGC